MQAKNNWLFPLSLRQLLEMLLMDAAEVTAQPAGSSAPSFCSYL